jgi:hypothetical protein
VVAGQIATYPFGGVVWDYGQYALGLERLGLDVYYLEDTGEWTYDLSTMHFSEESPYGVEFLQRSLATLSPSLAERWHYRAPDGSVRGLATETMKEVVAEADLFLNTSGICVLRDEYMRSRCKVLVDTDPGWNHFVGYARADQTPPQPPLHSFRRHDHFFTYAERLGSPGCRLPDLGISWHVTRPPVVLDQWAPEGSGARWTTVMSWNTYDEHVAHDGVVYGAKDVEFHAFERLPRRAPATFELAVAHLAGPVERLRELGWSVVDGVSVSRTADDYRQYVERSRGECSVAKHVYVATRSGWFSCRSVCYLASARPVVLQDTGFSEYLPTGDGLLAFSDLASAAAAIERVEAEYEHHAEAAREIARTEFAADTVLADMLDRVGVGGV